MSLKASKLNQWSQDHGAEGKSEDAVEMLDRIIQHRLRTIDPQVAKMLLVCKDWQPVGGVSSTVGDAVRALVCWLENCSGPQIRLPQGSPGSANESPKKRRQSLLEQSKASANPPQQYSTRTTEQTDETTDLFRSFVLAKLCEYFQQFLASGGNIQTVVQQRPPKLKQLEEGAAKPVTLDAWKCLLANVGLLTSICSHQRVPCNFKKFCEDRRIIKTLAHLLSLSPHASCACVLPILTALRMFVCTKEATEEMRLQRTLELTNAGIFSLLNSDLGPWVESALDVRNGVQEADHLLGCVGDLVRELLRHPGGCEAAENGDFVPTLNKVITDRLLAEPLLWPRASMLLMDAIEAIPKADYVQCGLDLSKSLRRMRSMVPTSDVSAIPSLLVLRLGELRRARQSKERRCLLRQRLGPRCSSEGSSRRPALPSRSGSEAPYSLSPPLTPQLPSVTKRCSSVNARKSMLGSLALQ